MALPKKRKKNISVKRRDLDAGPQEYQDQFLDQNKSFLPRGIDHADLDSGFVEFVEDDLQMVVNGDKVPVLFLTLARWREFAKTWQNSDKYKNVKIPFISIVRNPDAQPGTNPADFKIPVRKTFEYSRVPIWDGNKKGVDIHKVPQPVGVDLTYTVRLFSYKMRQLNKLNKKVLQAFASAQAYINIKGHYFPVMLESIGDESDASNLDTKRYYVQSYVMKLQGYLIDEDEFEVVPAIDRVFVVSELTDKVSKPKPRPVVDTSDNSVNLTFQFLIGPTVETTITVGEDMNLTAAVLTNILSYTIKLNGVITTLPVNALTNDEITITIVKVDTNEFGEVKLLGVKDC